MKKKQVQKMEIWEFENGFEIALPLELTWSEYSMEEENGGIGIWIQYHVFNSSQGKKEDKVSTTGVLIRNLNGKVIIEENDSTVYLKAFGNKKEQTIFLNEVFQMKETKAFLAGEFESAIEIGGFGSFEELEKESKKLRLRHTTGSLSEEGTADYEAYRNAKVLKEWLDSGCKLQESDIYSFA